MASQRLVPRPLVLATARPLCVLGQCRRASIEGQVDGSGDLYRASLSSTQPMVPDMG